MTDLMIAPEITDPLLQDEDPKEAHIVDKEDQMRGYFGGQPITALCGYTWIPTRDYAPLPVCEKCKQIYSQIKNAQNGMN